MKIQTLRVRWFWFGLMTAVIFAAVGTAEPLRRNDNGFAARITLSDGTVREVKFQGVGCTETICSRVLIRTEQENHAAAQIWLDSISAIRPIDQNTAVFVMRDGSERRLRFIRDFRVLYVTNSNGAAEKLDLGTIRSLELRGSAK